MVFNVASRSLIEPRPSGSGWEDRSLTVAARTRPRRSRSRDRRALPARLLFEGPQDQRILVLNEDAFAGDDRHGPGLGLGHLDPGEFFVLIAARLEREQVGIAAEGEH